MGNIYKFTSSAKFSTSTEEGNPNLGWLNFVLTDNVPNSNKQGIPTTAFAGLVSSGLHMPMKVARGEIKDGHDGAEPLGPITSLTEKDNQVAGIAAIWKEYRPEDYDMLKQMSEAGESIDISWELRYSESSKDDDGIEWLMDPCVLAATIVGSPAYSGRTPVTTVASKTNAADTTVDTTELDALKETVEALKTEVVELKGYREKREKEDAAASLLVNRLALLSDANYEYTEDEVEEHKAVWLEMSEDAFSAMVEMLKKTRSVTASTSTEVPDLSGSVTMNILETVRSGLREMKNSEEN